MRIARLLGRQFHMCSQPGPRRPSRKGALRCRAPRRAAAVLLPLPLLAACQGPQSTFADAGTEAARVATLFYGMVGGSVLIWLVVMGISVYATVAHPAAHGDKAGLRLILWGGAVFPAVTLTLLLVFGLRLMPDVRREADGPRIAVSGERFWWRIHYGAPDEPGVAKSLSGRGVEAANELWLPVGRRSEILVGSPDVIHSFWVPAIAGKTDTIPGRVNRLVVEPTREGVYNGICAEFCGTAHAQMGFRVVVVGEAEYDRYVARQAADAAVPAHPGRDAFLANGCGACHAVRGTGARGAVGPDLTHVGSRRTLGAGILPMSGENLVRFIAATGHEKPGVEMPSFGVLPPDELARIADWLGSLR